ncbi:amidohydrolase [Clostridium aceticum]|uniref:Amidohydrolase n=1 Tax=Clostridium aceticum TaxID=84022 RepID=A0A0D8I9S6_9CLOT|nr:amidohydrolase [Clostridium aceticum]AKL96018.1 amidohydrolase [Clostridium aceticum]KJF27045.1 amidohydrolase [Clostridium aceticum]
MKQENLVLVRQLRHELHRIPEISNHEVKTKQSLMDFLKKHTNLEIVDRGLWFYAIYHAGNDKKNIAFRADFDAVPMDENMNIPHGSQNPGVSHKCGHDGHAASLAGFALEIDQYGIDKNIFFLFQHAEETGDGAAQCVALIREHNIEEIFAYHNMSGMPLNSVNVIDGTVNFASRGMAIHMEGIPTHASQPELGTNPAYAIAKMINAIPQYTYEVNNKGIILCTIIQVDIGERAFGIAASKGSLLLTIRAEFEEELDELQKNLENLALKEGEAYDLEVNFSYHDVFPVTSNHGESSDKIRQVCKQTGIELIEMEVGFRTSEDFGHYLKETKGAICYVGNGVNHPHIHTSGYDFPDEIIETSVELFKGLAKL